MNIADLGITKVQTEFVEQNNLSSFEISRVIKEFKERYVISNGEKEYEAEILGNLRYTAAGRADFPAVGDFVLHQAYDVNAAIIHRVLPRRTIIERQTVGKSGEQQIIATNIDYAFIVQSVGYDFNINRLERYLTVVNTGKVLPILILNKIDLADEGEVESIYEQLKVRNINIPVYFLSSVSMEGYDEFLSLFEKGKTYCFLGSSGVGKSTLINKLLGEEQLDTSDISSSTSKGRHTTSHRELIVIENGSIVIDTPGMRELGMTDTTTGLEETFNNIHELASECKYSDCTHTSEVGCAVIEAVENGDLNEQSYKNYLKLEREKRHFQSTVSEKRNKDKEFGKMVKQVKKIDKRTLD